MALSQSSVQRASRRFPKFSSGYALLWGRHLRALLLLAAAGAVVLYIGRSQWFFGDEWDFLLTRDGASWQALLRPHNEHWSTIPIIIYRGLFNIVGLTSYIPYLAVLAFLNAVVAGLIYVLLWRAGVPWLVAALAGVMSLFMGVGSENLLWAFQIGFVGSVAAFLASVLVLETVRSKTGDWLVAGLLLIGLMSSGIGVGAVAAVALTLMARGEYRRAARTSLIPTAAFALWFWTHRTSVLGSHGADLFDSFLLLPSYVATSLTAAIDGVFGLGRQLGVGFVFLLAAALTILVIRRNRAELPVSTLAPIVMAVSVVSTAGLARASVFGVEQASASRYIHIVGIMLIITLGTGLVGSSLYREHASRSLTMALTTFAALVALFGLSVLRANSWASAVMREETRTNVLAMVAALQESEPNETISEARPIPHNPDISVNEIMNLIEQRPMALPETDSITEDEREIALALMQYRVSPDRPPAPGVAFDLVQLFDSTLVASADACTSIRAGASDPQVVVRVKGSGVLRVETDAVGEIQVFPLIDDTFEQEASTTVDISPSSPVWLWVAHGLDLVRLDPGENSTLRVCMS